MAQWTLWCLGLQDLPKPAPPAILDQIKHAERKNFPRKEAFDFDSELRKPNVELIVVFDTTDSDRGPLLAAYAVYARTSKVASLHKICVVEKYRRRGVATRLLVEQHRRLQLRGCNSIQLWVDEQRLPAKKLYQSNGFVEVGRAEHYYGPDRKALRMMLHLGRSGLRRMAFLISLLALSCHVLAAPSIGLPINAQVPPVARASKAFDFTFSESTFFSGTGTIDYATADAPDWLQLDSYSRTFSGLPGLEDTGAVNFSLIATDPTGSTPLPVTFVVSKNTGPGLGIPIDQQLATRNDYQRPATILLLHSNALSLSFSPDTFTDKGHDTVHYAICANNTPLPSWITFDPSHLSFSGTAPQETSPDELPQTFDIHFTASDVIGFSAAVASFRLVVENHIFTFANQQQVVNVTQGSPFTYDALSSLLTLNGQPVDHDNVRQIHVDKPDWVLFDEKSWSLSGTPSDQDPTHNICITATDMYGENATATIILQMENSGMGNLFNGDLESVNVTAGEHISYNFNGTTSSISGAELDVDVGPASWLNFNKAKQQLNGQVPSDLKPQQIILNVTLSSGPTSQSQPLIINIEGATHSSSSRSTDVLSPSIVSASATSSPTPSEASQLIQSQSNMRTHKARIAAAIAVPIVSVCLLLIVAGCSLRRRKRKPSGEDWISASKRKISRPFFSDNHSDGESVGQMVEKPVAVPKRASPRAPMSELPGFRSSIASKRRSLLHPSRTTTDECTQKTKVDSWHEYIQGLSIGSPKQSPQPQFSLIPEEHTSSLREGSKFSSRKHPSRSSRPSGVISFSPSKRFRQGRRRSDMSFASSAPLSSQRMSGFGHGNNGSSFGTPWFPVGIGHGNGGPQGFGSVRPSWRHPSIGSWTPTDSTIKTSDLTTSGSERSENVTSTMRPFHPPLTTGTDHPSRPPSIHELEDDRRVLRASIRAVEPDSPQMYGQPLHTFHKRRARNRDHRNTFFSAGPSSRASSHLDWIHSNHVPVLSPTQSMTTVESGVSRTRTYSLRGLKVDRLKHACSQSSSLDPSPSKPRPSPRARMSGISTGNNPGGLATLVSNAITRRFHSSKSSLASSQRLGSTAGNDHDSELGLSSGVGLEEERDEEGNRRWRYADVHPNPLGWHTPPSTIVGSPSDLASGQQRETNEQEASSPAARRMSQQYLQRLSFLRQQGGVADGGRRALLVGESGRGRLAVGGSRGKRPVSVDNGLIARGLSMKGDLVGQGEEVRGGQGEREVAFL
ncbi:MAG: hypothetical protein LQ352_003329 [Teloschistes flavicans]|nr:MAG: hypothetical protein LQ352_003329 [Teloschistes flavicans]